MAPADLSELERARAALAASEMRLRLVLEGSNDGWWDWDLLADAIFYSPRWWRTLGYAEGELPADTGLWRRLMHPADAAEVDRVFGGALAEGPDNFEVELRLRHKAGHHVPILARGHILRNAEGRPVRVSGTNTDISARLQAEAARRESEASQSALLGSMADGVFVAQDHRFVFANPALPALLGYRTEEFIGARFERMLDPQYLGLWSERFERRIAGRGRQQEPPRHYEVRFLAKDGSPRWLELRANRIEFRGRPGVLGILRDIGERKRAEASLRQSEERWKFALDAAGDGVWDWNMAAATVLFSPRCTELLGDAPASQAMTVQDWHGRVHPDDMAHTMTAFEAYRDGRAPSFRCEHRMRRADGSWIWLITRGLIVSRGPGGEPLRMVGTYTDLTERKAAEAERAALEARLREAQKMEAIGTLAGGVAHDFNNVLAGILGNATLARQDLEPGHPALHSLEQIRKAGMRARALVQQILAFSRRQPQALVNQPMQPLVEESLALLRATLPAAVALEARLAPQPLSVLADATQVQQVLMNLCTNAWHALEGGSGTIVVGLQEAALDGTAPAGLAPGAYAHLWVSDDGCGIDPAACERIFEPFYTTKPVGQGTGLGLAVVHGIVTAHGGAITLESRPGAGSTFHLHFPLIEPEDEALLGEPSEHAALGGGEHVLYIDDDEIMVLAVERLLQRAGYQVSCHLDARAALAALRELPQAYDLVVTDFNMPGLSGLDVAREALALRPELPVVISSGYISDELHAEAGRLGVRRLLHKERTVEELGKLVQRVLAEAARAT